jgi:Na+-translocating ferredoxin:NAD+ oxidoreductase RnfD subunit
LIITGLAVGAVLGFGGNFLPVGPAQTLTYASSSLGIIMGSALLAAWFAGQGKSTVAVGFALLALAEGSVLLSVFALAGGTQRPAFAFAAGTALYVMALLVASLPPVLPIWVRILGVLAAIPFATYALLSLLDQHPAPSDPLASVGYVLLILAIIGWIVTVLRATPASR